MLRCASITVALATPGLLAAALWAAPNPPQARFDDELRARTEAAIDKGLAFLKSTQREDGSWTHFERPDPAITALAAKCFLQHPRYGTHHSTVTRALDSVIAARKPDGGIYPEAAGLNNYYTSVCVMALSAAGERYAAVIQAAQEFLTKGQWDGGESIDTANVWYGGAGYGKGKRPDLSNTQMMIEALHQSGLPADHPAYQKAVKFIERCQMHSAVNDQPFAQQSSDGGMIYTPANGGESKAGTAMIEGRPQLRTYGSMTYAGFKSYLYAGLKRDDPRVQAALDWIRRHWDLDHNPNMPGAQSREGLYYYYLVFARAMHAWGEPVITDAQGVAHDWRAELAAKLIELQNPDGSWVNPADRWYEGNPMLVTAYSVLALQTVLAE